MDISCAFPTTLRSPEDIAIAEELGYARAWLYDTPQQSPDVWMSLALAAQRTTRIGLGPGVLVPSLRHPMVNAAATATLEALAPGRVAVGFGTGFSGRRAMGYPGLAMKFMVAYVRAYKGLLRGETVEWEGARMRCCTRTAARPRDRSTYRCSSASSARGWRVAPELGDGLLAQPRAAAVVHDRLHVESRCSPGEPCSTTTRPTDSAHARAAAGPGWALELPRHLRVRRPRRRARPSRVATQWQSRRGERPAGAPSRGCTTSTASALNEADQRPGSRAPTDARGVDVSGTRSEVRERRRGAARPGHHRVRPPALRRRRPRRADEVQGSDRGSLAHAVDMPNGR